MKVKEILGEVTFTSHLPYNPQSDAGPYNMSDPGNEDISFQSAYGEQEEDGDEEFGLCSQCNGTGEGQYDGSRCGVCKGSGVIDNREKEDPDDQRDRMRDAEWDGSGPDRGGWDSDE